VIFQAECIFIELMEEGKVIGVEKMLITDLSLKF
jgi:uncharacterized protein YuzE